MVKKVTFNGIELAQSKYDKTTLIIFDFLDNLKNLLEKGLNKKDENFQFSINVDFASDKAPKHKIYTNGPTTKKTKDKVARILKKTQGRDYSHVAGSVKAHLLVEDRI